MIKRDDDFRNIFSMLSIITEGEWTDLRETYFKKIALPEVKKLKKSVKTPQEALDTLKEYFKKEKVNTPKFYEN